MFVEYPRDPLQPANAGTGWKTRIGGGKMFGLRLKLRLAQDFYFTWKGVQA